jgi:DNA primase
MFNEPKQCGQYFDKLKIASIKDRLTIPVLWQILKLPGIPRKSCHSPFREDRRPSFSIYDNDRRWKDHSTGDGGDGIEFIAKAKGITQKEAFKLFLTIAKEQGYDRS